MLELVLCYNEIMAEITAIEPQKKKEDRFNIFVDGKFGFGLDAGTLVKSSLKIGQEISEKEIERLVFENETNKLMEKALRFLSFRPRSERELRNRLKTRLSKRLKNSADGIIDNVLVRLKHLDYVDDLEFTKWWVEQRQTHSPHGLRLIKGELYQKGIVQEIIDKVLSEDEEGEIGRALKAAKKKLRSYDLKSRESKKKMGQYLARRGFDWEIIKETLSRIAHPSDTQ